MPDIGYVNGRFSALADAVVSVEDRGFQFGDGVYEVVRTYHNVPFQLDAHLTRLKRSAEALQLRLPASLPECRDIIQESIRRAEYPECKIYIQLTRGTAPRDHPFPETVHPTLVVTVREMRLPPESLRAAGVHAVTIDDYRWGRCDIKSVNLLANVLARQQAKEAGVFEALFVRDGKVLEGSVSNVFIVSTEGVMTAPEGPTILSGVTRSLVLELAREARLDVREQAPSREALYSASEIFLTGTTIEILAIVRVDGCPIGSGSPGPVARLLSERWQKMVS